MYVPFRPFGTEAARSSWDLFATSNPDDRPSRVPRSNHCIFSYPYDPWDDCIFTYISHKHQPNVGKYIIPRSYGILSAPIFVEASEDATESLLQMTAQAAANILKLPLQTRCYNVEGRVCRC